MGSGGGGGGGGGGLLYLDKLRGEVVEDCDVGLGLKSTHEHADPFVGFPPSARSSSHHEQRNNSSSCFLSHPSLKSSSSSSSSSSSCWGDGGGSGSGGCGGGGVGATFSASQRRELERQTAIYKCMMSSAHIPPQLLLPTTLSNYSSDHIHFNTFSRSPTDQCSRGGKSSLDLRFAGSGKDPEPWRCRRTDGKKWRCSRDVAPDQKYCERHTHKGRPSRSRKPVESPSKKSESHPYTLNTFSTSSAASSDAPHDQSIPSMKFYQNQRSSFLNQTPQYNQTRYSEWLMKRDADAAFPVSNVYQNIDQMVHSGDNPMGEGGTIFGNKFPYFPPHRKNVLDGGSEQSRGLNQQSCVLPRQFLDAWSVGENQDSRMDEMNRNSSSNANLTLSMSAAANSNSDPQGETRTTHAPNWMMSPIGVGVGGGASWMSSTPGGPLAEALCLGIAGGSTKGCDAGASEAPPHGFSCETATPSSSKSSHDDCINGYSEGGLSFMN